MDGIKKITNWVKATANGVGYMTAKQAAIGHVERDGYVGKHCSVIESKKVSGRGGGLELKLVESRPGYGQRVLITTVFKDDKTGRYAFNARSKTRVVKK